MSSTIWLSLKMHLHYPRVTLPKIWPLIPKSYFVVVQKKLKCMYKNASVVRTLDFENMKMKTGEYAD